MLFDSLTQTSQHAVQYSVWHCQYWGYIASNEKDDWWIEKDFKGSGRGLIKALSQHIPEGTEENHERPQSG
jgi:hypothetical protein